MAYWFYCICSRVCWFVCRWQWPLMRYEWLIEKCIQSTVERQVAIDEEMHFSASCSRFKAFTISLAVLGFGDRVYNSYVTVANREPRTGNRCTTVPQICSCQAEMNGVGRSTRKQQNIEPHKPLNSWQYSICLMVVDFSPTL